MFTYHLKARRLDLKTVVWDLSALDFFNNVTNRLVSYTLGDSYVYWDATMGYNDSVKYEYIKYRNAAGNIVTVGQGESVVTYNHTLDGRVGLATLPSGYNPLNLLSQNKSDPYLEIRFADWHEIREQETTFNNNLGQGTHLELSVEYKEIAISKFEVTRDHANDRYMIKIQANYLEKYTVEVINVNELEGNKTAITLTSLEEISYIPEKYFKEGSNILNVTAYNGTKTAFRTLTISHVTPTLTEVSIENENGLIDNITTVTWTSKNQGKAEIYNNDKLIKSVGTVTVAVLPKGTLNVGKNKIEVRVYNVGDSNVINSIVSVSKVSTITLARILPSIEKNSFSINDTNTDNVITAAWKSTNQSRFGIYQGDRLVSTGVSGQTVDIARGTLSIGSTNLKLVIYYDSGFDTVQVEEVIATVLTQNTPIIYNLEPSNLNINIDEIVNVTFATNEFCDSWELTAAGLNTKGTDARSVSFGKEVFKQGKNEMTLKIFYSPKYNNEIRTATKKVTFTGYGTPKTPIFDGNVLYSTATPQLTWESIDQVEIHLLIVEAESEEVVQEKLEFTEDKFATLETLEDDKTYIATLAVKNKYGLWSEYAKKEFQTKFNDIILPTFDLFEAETSVFITIGGIQDPNFKAISIYRKSEREDVWTEIADDCNIEDTIRDYMCPANLKIAYKLRVYDKNNAYKDTEIKTISISLSSYILTNLENAEDVYMIFGTPSYKFNGDFVSKLYAGQRAPRTFKGKVQYKTGTFRTALKNADAYNLIDFIENSNEYNLFCLRDQRGEKLYVIAKLESQDPKGLKRLSVSFSFTEVNFIESKMYTGSGYKKISYLNGEYYLDGSVDLSGYDLSVTLE
ncbi:hypothetical protein [Cellulosilyticum lentocellum]|uniref:Uncharacterized protein n=1 Tax=Cellulosilyticum lentocellum (strain ATCC 49066 / DSM 5427 / NCIMB 11756 / RHM5) TaxID=642492 RepID=F2JPD8_CELLD|nr:hypothetical protein [Cellulosilyticum lentocellum]ADZ82486.1 hypothetical protein Clole_0753 [Cellulosilyticum lentocellum DSM 5427]